jgi:hypothetical protein
MTLCTFFPPELPLHRRVNVREDQESWPARPADEVCPRSLARTVARAEALRPGGIVKLLPGMTTLVETHATNNA